MLFSWDIYLEDSLKAATRSKRGQGIRRRVKPDTIIPKNWSTFLRDDNNKTELFAFLAQVNDILTTFHLVRTKKLIQGLCFMPLTVAK